jgi:hypothetical protein
MAWKGEVRVGLTELHHVRLSSTYTAQPNFPPELSFFSSSKPSSLICAGHSFFFLQQSCNSFLLSSLLAASPSFLGLQLHPISTACLQMSSPLTLLVDAAPVCTPVSSVVMVLLHRAGPQPQSGSLASRTCGKATKMS